MVMVGSCPLKKVLLRCSISYVDESGPQAHMQATANINSGLTHSFVLC